MNVNLERWHRLCAETEALGAQNQGMTSRWTQLSERRNLAMRELLQTESQRNRQFGVRPAEGQTLETAQAAVRAANQSNPDRRRPIASDYDIAWFQTKAAVDEVDAELARLDESQAALNGRLGPLRRLREAVERYASANGIGLRGVDNSRLSHVALTARLSGAATGEVAAASARIVGARR